MGYKNKGIDVQCQVTYIIRCIVIFVVTNVLLIDYGLFR